MGQQVARSIEDIVRTGSNEHPLLSTVDIITGRDWGSQYPAYTGLIWGKTTKAFGNNSNIKKCSWFINRI